MALGQWKEAITAADEALLLDKDYVPALACKAQSLYAMKYFSDAYNVSRKLIEELGDDPALLFYHAKIAHEARAYTDEIRTLEKLIKMAEEQQRPAAGYRVYLGQAYATDGQAEPALEQFAQGTRRPGASNRAAEVRRRELGDDPEPHRRVVGGPRTQTPAPPTRQRKRIEELSERVLRTIQAEHMQPRGGRRFPVPFWIIPHMQGFGGCDARHLQRAFVDEWFWLIGTHLAGDHPMIEKRGNAEIL